MFRTAVFLPHNRIIFLSVKGAGSGTSPCCGRDEQVRASLLLSSLAWFAVLDAAGLALPSASAALASGAAVLVPHPRVCSADSAVCAACTGRAPLLVTDANDRRCRGGGGKVPPTAARTRTRGSHRALWGGGGRVCVNPRVTVAAAVCCRLPIHARPTAWASSGVRGRSARGRRPRPLPPGETLPLLPVRPALPPIAQAVAPSSRPWSAGAGCTTFGRLATRLREGASAVPVTVSPWAVGRRDGAYGRRV